MHNLDSISNVNIQDRYGKTFLMQVAATGDQDVVKKLLQNQAAVNVRDSDKRSALFYAVQGGHAKTARLVFSVF